MLYNNIEKYMAQNIWSSRVPLVICTYQIPIYTQNYKMFTLSKHDPHVAYYNSSVNVNDSY